LRTPVLTQLTGWASAERLWRGSFVGQIQSPARSSGTHRYSRRLPEFRKIALVLFFSTVTFAVLSPLAAREKGGIQYGAGIIVNLPFSENQVDQVVQDVVQNGIIRGTKEYNKDEYVSGATPESSLRVFPAWSEGGRVFYKVREHALDPRNFKDGGDVGTLAVRYIVQAQGDKNTVLRINAVFVEDFRHTVHLSNGSVENAELKDIHDRLDRIASIKAEAVEVERERQNQSATSRSRESAPLTTVPSVNQEADGRGGSVTPQAAQPVVQTANPVRQGDAQTLEERVKDLRRQVELIVKAPGAALRSAPFHTATSLQSLPAGTEVLVVITTPYWLGVETHDGQHGWMLRDDLESLP
jgi:hypothetical protein